MSKVSQLDNTSIYRPGVQNETGAAVDFLSA